MKEKDENDRGEREWKPHLSGGGTHTHGADGG